jgi:hypothetical protein
MKTYNFPFIALALGLLLSLLITKGSQPDSSGETLLPLLTLLIINECAFILTAAGIFIGVKHITSNNFSISNKAFYTITVVLCGLLCIQFLLLGFKLWPL